ncbi:hypothetical protein [Sabulicella glaciei]|uniref:DUF1902 domain-containing protein n=1 Tax=Sabulicella glaciei TaxID=2984948 RepID=A0ABT3NSW7_9PROT|nr:hypothetical protein [Roseococcus sp. MDT2-1-1]MCW8085247.1 hypothetical protein [Roseococcus sp. MDT2-1-1]
MGLGNVMSRVKLRAAPGRVYLALQEPAETAGFSFAELTPAEALRIAEGLADAARAALRNADDRAPLREGVAPWFAPRETAV